ncbi:hypothetical protein TSAR_011694 [Trichomalopsis sarcophagae]|uniref:Uncharacterized protein n=1 Tax=Trichomalopsis sarcophagae TaxID=543379 RepID=A0A232ET82_9HYME|nr:hypothetical protein TSAR_011694 [Trichomalopsis sarcophagae]
MHIVFGSVCSRAFFIFPRYSFRDEMSSRFLLSRMERPVAIYAKSSEASIVGFSYSRLKFFFFLFVSGKKNSILWKVPTMCTLWGSSGIKEWQQRRYSCETANKQ